MINLKIYSVSHREFRDEVTNNLLPEEKQKVYCYIVNDNYPKNDENFSKKIENIKEYELSFYNKYFQEHRYLEYSLIPHIYMNENLTSGCTHVGMVHSDIIFEKDSINNIMNELEKNPNQLFYNTFFNSLQQPDGGPLYLSPEQLVKICDYSSQKLKMFINYQKILSFGWIGSMCVGPVEVFKNFGKFIIDNYQEIQEIIEADKWNIQSYPNKHSVCGIIERMWGFYLVNLNLPIKYMNIIHDRNQYTHDHGII